MTVVAWIVLLAAAGFVVLFLADLFDSMGFVIAFIFGLALVVGAFLQVVR